MATQMQRRSRQATPQRWQKALARALEAGIEARQIAGTGEWIVPSVSKPGVAYRTDGVHCDCEAAMLGADPVCVHRAAYWFARGVLEVDDPAVAVRQAAGILQAFAQARRAA